MKTLVVFFLMLSFFSVSAVANPGVEVQVLEKEIIAQIDVVAFQATLKITFENVIGLSADSVSISAVQINPLDVALVSRLPGALVTIPAQFPLLINVSPTPTSSLSFTGVVEMELSTSNLPFASKLRLFTSPNGGAFTDVTNFAGIGSYRVRGTSGDFSDFLIAADVRNAGQVINLKFNELQNALTTHAAEIDPASLLSLQSKLDAARASYNQGQKQQAAEHLEAMNTEIKADNGQTIPNIYRANDPNTTNVAGDLRRRAATLIFSIRL